jgi:glycine/D-amino acid oxidase-like deaminating enzyme
VVPFRLFMGATKPLDDKARETILPGGHSLSDSRRVLWPFRLDRDGRLITGGDHVIPIGSRDRVARAVMARVREAFPQIERIEIEFAWDGKVAMTLDRLPRYLELGAGLHAGLGYNGRGIALSTAMGRLLADRATGLDPAALPLPISPLKPLPFHGLSIPVSRAALAWYQGLDKLA